MKTLLWIVVAVIIVGIGWYLVSQQGLPTPAPATQTAPTSETTAPQGGPSLTQGSSNAELTTDLSTIDSQVSGAQSDSAAVNQGLNDQPVAQTE